MNICINKLAEKWLIDLETTDARQVQGVLFDGEGYCCLGRACVVAGIEPFESPTIMNNVVSYVFDDETQFLPTGLVERLGLIDTKGHCKDNIYPAIYFMNDKLHMSFKQIARVLRENPSLYFVPA